MIFYYQLVRETTRIIPMGLRYWKWGIQRHHSHRIREEGDEIIKLVYILLKIAYQIKTKRFTFSM